MSLTVEQLKWVREAIGVAIDGGTLASATIAELQLINQAIIDGSWAFLKGNQGAQLAVTLLYDATNDVPVYESAVSAFANELKVGSAPPPAPTVPTTPTAPTSGSQTIRAASGLSAQEISSLRDLNFSARRDYQTLETNSPYGPRLLTMSFALRDGTSWTDENPSYLLGMMVATSEGSYPPNRALIEKYAAAVGLSIVTVPPPSSAPVTTQPAPTTPSTTPAPSVQVPADLKATLEAMGAVFAPNGQLSGFKVCALGAEGYVYGFLGVNDGASRNFYNVREKIGGQWPDVDRNPSLPMIMGPVIERDGGVSFDFEPPLLASDPNPRPNKTFLMYLAGFLRDRGPRDRNTVGRFIDLISAEAGRGWRLNTRRTGSATVDITTAFEIDADSPNPCVIRVGDQLRRVVLDGEGRFVAGEVVSEDQ